MQRRRVREPIRRRNPDLERYLHNEVASNPGIRKAQLIESRPTDVTRHAVQASLASLTKRGGPILEFQVGRTAHLAVAADFPGADLAVLRGICGKRDADVLIHFFKHDKPISMGQAKSALKTGKSGTPVENKIKQLVKGRRGCPPVLEEVDCPPEVKRDLRVTRDCLQLKEGARKVLGRLLVAEAIGAMTLPPHPEFHPSKAATSPV